MVKAKEPMQVWRLHKTTTVVEEIEVRARTLKEAEQAAESFKGPSVGVPKISYRAQAHWPVGEPEEVEHDLGNGYRVRRGWFWQVNKDYASVCFLPDRVDPCNYGVTVDSFKNLIGGNETIFHFGKVYGWAASQGGMSTWSKVHETADAAYKDCRKYVAMQQQQVRDRQRFDRENAEALRLERLMNKTILRMRANSDKMTRLNGGKWITEDATFNANDEPWSFEEKWMVDLLIHEGMVEVTDRMNKSGDPRIVHLTEQGRARAAEAVQMPEFLR